MVNIGAIVAVQDVSRPFIQLRLGIRNPDTDTVEHVAFNMTVDKFKVLLHGMRHTTYTSLGGPPSAS